MRTRFLNIDYFNSTPVQALETLEFLRLPPPHLPPSNPSDSGGVHCFDDVSPVNVSLEIGTLPISKALENFFSDVIPCLIDVEAEEVPSAHSCSEEARSIEFRNVNLRNGDAIPEEKNEITLGGNGFDIFEFEMPVLDLSSEDASFLDEAKLQFFSEIAEVEHEDMLESVLLLHHPSRIIKSFYAVDDIVPDYYNEQLQQKAFLSEVHSSAKDHVQLHDITFPLLEVDEISLGIFSDTSLEESLLAENMVPQVCPRGEEAVLDGKELVASLNTDILECVSGYSLLKQWPGDAPMCSSISRDTDLISIIELPYSQPNLTLQPSDDNFIWSLYPVHFEETPFLHVDLPPFQDVFSNILIVLEGATCEQMFAEGSHVWRFNDLVVSHELILENDSFTSLPIPILTDHGYLEPVTKLVENIFGTLDQQPSSASDGIYLDWHLLEEDYRNQEKYSVCWKHVLEISNYDIGCDMISLEDGKLIFDLVFSDDIQNVKNVEDNKETLDIIVSEFVPDKCLSDGDNNLGDDEPLFSGAEKVPTPGKSVPESNDLNFFLFQPGPLVENGPKLAVRATHGNPKLHAVLPRNQVVPPATASVQKPKWDLKLYPVKLSVTILELFDNLHRNHVAVTDTAKKLSSSLAVDDTRMLRLSKQKMMDCIKEANARKMSLTHEDESATEVIAVYAIKKMSWYLCYYGIHIAHQYVNKLCRTLDFLRFRLEFLHNLITDMHREADRDVALSHPSLAVIKDILLSHINICSYKVLIVAEQVFWWPLKKLLTSMGLTIYKQHNFLSHSRQHDWHCNEFSSTKHDAQQHSGCCLISKEQVSTSFPFEKFNLILEYGGSCNSSIVCTIAPKQLQFPSLHFLKLELDDSRSSKVLCEGFDMPCSTEFTTKLEELLNFVPMEENDGMGIGSSTAVDEVNDSFSHFPSPCVPPVVAIESEKKCSSPASPPTTVVIVNTQDLDKEMIISRRSTYQKILSLEKQGTEVVERDLKFPVDIIISAAACLVWYDSRNIGKKATAADEASSCLPLCIENIAANILTLLSFSFSCCILVFEGDSSFLTTAMESTHELYAAAVSLGIDLQLFFSHSADLTDEIIMRCIGCAAKTTRQIYPKMLESETLAESFLTMFPSINPLSAHAILASGAILVEFLEWSHDRRVCELKKFLVPDESVSLLSTLCKYGEREDSRSGLSECSSSMSSVPDSKNCYRNINSGKKIGETHRSPQKITQPMSDLNHFQTLKRFSDGNLKDFKPHGTWFPDEEIVNEIEDPGDPLIGKMNSHQGLGPSTAAAVMKPLRMSNINTPGWHMDDEEIVNEIEDPGDPLIGKMNSHQGLGPSTAAAVMKPLRMSNINTPGWHMDDDMFGPDGALGMAPHNGFSHPKNDSQYSGKELIGEVIDIADSLLNNQAFSSHLVGETDREDHLARNFRPRKKLSHSGAHLPTFPTAAEVTSDSKMNSHQGLGPSTAAAVMKPLRMSNINTPGWHMDDDMFGPDGALGMAPHNGFSHPKNDSQYSGKELIGEVIDIADSLLNNQAFSSHLVGETDREDHLARNFRPRKKLSHSGAHLPTFPTAAEVTSDSNHWASIKDPRPFSGEGFQSHTNADFTSYQFPLNNNGTHLEEVSVHEIARNAPKEHHGGTPLSKAIHSAQSNQGSPWTIEFLNGIREKSRARQQSLPHDMSPLCLAYSGNISKASKRKSPSILDFYKYQGGNTRRTATDIKRQRQSTQRSTLNKSEKASSSVPTWTPLDKRARQTLSFSTGGAGSQSKLVWGEKEAHMMDRRRYC